MKAYMGVDHPFFRPMYRRILTTGFCAAWALMELLNGAPFWAILFGALAAYCGYYFFVVAEFRDGIDKLTDTKSGD